MIQLNNNTEMYGWNVWKGFLQTFTVLTEGGISFEVNFDISVESDECESFYQNNLIQTDGWRDEHFRTVKQKFHHNENASYVFARME